jgi:hypothetical protein
MHSNAQVQRSLKRITNINELVCFILILACTQLSSASAESSIVVWNTKPLSGLRQHRDLHLLHLVARHTQLSLVMRQLRVHETRRSAKLLREMRLLAELSEENLQVTIVSGSFMEQQLT